MNKVLPYVVYLQMVQTFLLTCMVGFQALSLRDPLVQITMMLLVIVSWGISAICWIELSRTRVLRPSQRAGRWTG